MRLHPRKGNAAAFFFFFHYFTQITIMPEAR